MQRILDSVDLVIECRDYRLPLTSRNPLFEESLAGTPRMIVYTKRDLGRKGEVADFQVRFLERINGLTIDIEWLIQVIHV